MSAHSSPQRPVQLSICIPTYNFGAFIGQTLESVLPQVSDGVEVIVLDGGSTDDTAEVVHSFERRFPSLRYHQLEQRGGIDRDLARTVAVAQGEFCWLFCSDDVMKPGAVARMLENIGSGHDVYICGFTICTSDMRPIRESPIMRTTSDAEFDLSDERERHVYFELAETTPAFFSFAGSIVVKTARWDSRSLDEAFVGTCWAHVARLFSLIPDGLRLKFLADSYLDKRSENDSFMDRGLVRRYALAIDGYHRLARTYFGDGSVEARNIRRVVRNEFPPWILLDAGLQSLEDGRRDDLPLLDRLARTTYRDPTAKNRFYSLVYRGTPLPAYSFARSAVRALKALVPSRRRAALVP